VLQRRAQRAGYRGSLRSLVQQLSRIRTATFAEQHPGRGRPQVYQQTEDCDPALRRLGEALGAVRD
jgi:hypothetical protein